VSGRFLRSKPDVASPTESPLVLSEGLDDAESRADREDRHLRPCAHAPLHDFPRRLVGEAVLVEVHAVEHEGDEVQGGALASGGCSLSRERRDWSNGSGHRTRAGGLERSLGLDETERADLAPLAVLEDLQLLGPQVARWSSPLVSGDQVEDDHRRARAEFGSRLLPRLGAGTGAHERWQSDNEDEPSSESESAHRDAPNASGDRLIPRAARRQRLKVAAALEGRPCPGRASRAAHPPPVGRPLQLDGLVPPRLKEPEPSGEQMLELLHVEVDHRRHEQGQRLGDDQAADDRQTQGAARLGASP
jgi:hypothetical protein